jgi:hypothetical protein
MTQTLLPAFEDAVVHKSTVRVVKTGDGLSEALDLEPQALHLGDEVCFVIRGKVSQVNHREGTDNAIVRQHTVECTGIAPIDQGTADEMIANEADRIAKLRDEKNGHQRIDA